MYLLEMTMNLLLCFVCLLRKPIRDNPKIFTKSEKMFLKSENISNHNFFGKSSLKSLSNLKRYYKS